MSKEQANVDAKSQTLTIFSGINVHDYENHEITIRDLETDIPQSCSFSSLSLTNSLTTNLVLNSNKICVSGDNALIPDFAILSDLEVQARSISSNINMALRDLRGICY